MRTQNITFNTYSDEYGSESEPSQLTIEAVVTFYKESDSLFIAGIRYDVLDGKGDRMDISKFSLNEQARFEGMIVGKFFDRYEDL